MSLALVDDLEQGALPAERATVRIGRSDCPPRPGWKAALEVLIAAAYVAIAAGLVESAFWLVQRHVFRSYIFLHPGFWWMSPASQLGLVALPAIVLATIAWRRPRWDALPAGVTVFSLI